MHPQIELIWASPRELLNIFQADRSAATSSPSRTTCSRSSPLVGKDLDEYSLDTVKMFRDDAVKAGFRLE